MMAAVKGFARTIAGIRASGMAEMGYNAFISRKESGAPCVIFSQRGHKQQIVAPTTISTSRMIVHRGLCLQIGAGHIASR